MKTQVAIASLGLAMLLAGCTTTSTVTLDRVGPAKQPASTAANQGCLVVYSAISPSMNLVDPDTDLHTDYTILANDGPVYRQVKNWVSKVLREPATVSLPPGEYTIVADAAGHGPVRVPVLVEANRTTTVFLDGEAHRGFKDVQTANLVSLPDGSIVGWRAE